MKIQQIQNNNYNSGFHGTIKIQNFKNGRSIIEKQTSLALDRGLENDVFNNIFEGSWVDCKKTVIDSKQLKHYAELLNLTLGIHLPKINHDVPVKLKHSNNGYSIKAYGEYEIIHKHDDFRLFE